jgi:flavin reductase (DIM6/NTAB) family NADH-FMN oxidoreductase RutF
MRLWLLALCWNIASCNSFEIALTPPLLDVPTYSLATNNEGDGGTGMNIMTYASPMSVSPDRLWAIGLFKNTQSHANFIREKRGVLQLLTANHIPLVKLLGGSSGFDVDKQAACEELGCAWKTLLDEDDVTDDSHPLVLPDCHSYLVLTQHGPIIDGGSHDIAICKVEAMYTASTKPYLSTSALRELGIITDQGRVSDETS